LIMVLEDEMNFREMERIIKTDGWRFKNANGSHYNYVHPAKPGKVTIPFHTGDIPKIVVKNILRQAKIQSEIMP